MALNERYIIASDLEQYFVDKDSGEALAAGTLSFYRDSARNTPKEVFQLSGSPPNYTYTSMGAVITLSSVGTVQNSGGDNEVVYYYPYDSDGNIDLYYVVCADSDGTEQFTREAWPNITSGTDPTQDETVIQNQISNPTFTNVFINDGQSTTYTVSAASSEVFAFAPNWDFVISGTGTVAIQRIALTGNDNVATSPPYVLDVNVSSGITACYLRQRFSANSGLWASTANQSVYLAGSYVGRDENGATAGVQLIYAESTGGSPITIVDGLVDANYELVADATADPIPQSTNTDSGTDGYVDIYLSFNASSNVRISAIQVIPTSSNSTNVLPYDTNSSNREESLQGDYYIPRLNEKTQESHLVGWDFQVNPYQFGTSGSVTTTPAYITDQTIAWKASSGTIAWAIDSTTGGLEFTTSDTTDAFAIMQYLSGDQVKRMIGSSLSTNIFGYKANGDDITMRVYLYRGSSSASIPTLSTVIGTLGTDGTFTLTASNWTLFARSGLDIPTATLNDIAASTDINDGNDYGFTGWELTSASEISNTDKFAILVTFVYPDSGQVVTVNSVSVVPGDIPSRPALKTYDETLRDCQYYYEKSYAPGTAAGSTTINGSIMLSTPLYDNGATTDLIAKSFTINFKEIKRAAPTMSFYAYSSATADRIGAEIWQPGSSVLASAVVTFSTYFTEVGATVERILCQANSISTMANHAAAFDGRWEGIIHYHYVADARLGIV